MFLQPVGTKQQALHRLRKATGHRDRINAHSQTNKKGNLRKRLWRGIISGHGILYCFGRTKYGQNHDWQWHNISLTFACRRRQWQDMHPRVAFQCRRLKSAHFSSRETEGYFKGVQHYTKPEPGKPIGSSKSKYEPSFSTSLVNNDIFVIYSCRSTPFPMNCVTISPSLGSANLTKTNFSSFPMTGRQK